MKILFSPKVDLKPKSWPRGPKLVVLFRNLGPLLHTAASSFIDQNWSVPTELLHFALELKRIVIIYI